MGSTLSKSETCSVWCGMEDDSYPEPMLNDDAATTTLRQDVALGTEVRTPALPTDQMLPAHAYLPDCRCFAIRSKEREPLSSNSSQQVSLCLSDCPCRDKPLTCEINFCQTCYRFMRRHMINCTPTSLAGAAELHVTDFRCTKDP